MTAWRDTLAADGLLLPTGVDGLYGHDGRVDAVLTGIDQLLGRLAAPLQAEIMRFPPAMNRAHFNHTGYLKSFPQLVGSVRCFCGTETDHRALLRCVDAGRDWDVAQQQTQLVLTPAACYPVYPLIAQRGPLPPEGAVVDVASWCFRHEPSVEPTRQQMFRMHEFVRLGTAAQAQRFREIWMQVASTLMDLLHLPHTIDLANDPFFGRAGRMLAESQREQALKCELLVPINAPDAPTACASFNYHQDHFAQLWTLCDSTGALAHTACCGFGLERLTLALLRHHGTALAAWPDDVRAALAL